MTVHVVQVEKVANGYLVQDTAGRRVYIAAAPIDVATILEEEIWPDREDDPEPEPAAAAPSVEELEAAGVVKRGSDLPAPEPEPVERQQVADDGGEYPKVTHHGGRWTMDCPNHGISRAEFVGQVLRCVARDNGKRCAVSMPLEAAHRAAGLT